MFAQAKGRACTGPSDCAPGDGECPAVKSSTADAANPANTGDGNGNGGGDGDGDSYGGTGSAWPSPPPSSPALPVSDASDNTNTNTNTSNNEQPNSATSGKGSSVVGAVVGSVCGILVIVGIAATVVLLRGQGQAQPPPPTTHHNNSMFDFVGNGDENRLPGSDGSISVSVNDGDGDGNGDDGYLSVRGAAAAANAGPNLMQPYSAGKGQEHDYTEIDEADDGKSTAATAATRSNRCLYTQPGSNGKRCRNTTEREHCSKHECTTPGCLNSKTSHMEVCDTCHIAQRDSSTTTSGNNVDSSGGKASNVPVVQPAAVVGGYVPPNAAQMSAYDVGDAPGASVARQMQRKEKKKKAQQQGSVYLGFDDHEDNEESML